MNTSHVILSSPGMHEIAQNILAKLHEHGNAFSHCEVNYTGFANDERTAQIPETVRGKHVYFLHPLQYPDPNTAFMSMLIAADALTRASVASITLVIPYIPYLRQDRKDKPRVPITARLIANLIETNKKIERIITFDMHADQEQGFFMIPVDNLYGMVVHAEHFRKLFRDDFTNTIVVAPDFGSSVRARRFAERLDPSVSVAIIEKRRKGLGRPEAMGIIGPSLSGRDAILYDDMIDTGGTIQKAGEKIREQNPRSVHICATHGLFSKDAEEKFKDAGVPVVITPTIPRPVEYWTQHSGWLSCVEIDQLLADAIHEASIIGGSVTKLST